MQRHLYFVQAGLLKPFPAWENTEVFALIPNTDSKAKLQAESLENENWDYRKWHCMLSKQRALTAAFHHGAAWEEHCSILPWGTSGGSFAGRHREAGKRAVTPRAVDPATASSNWDYFWHCSLCKRALSALFPRLIRLFAQDPTSFRFLSESAEPTIQFSSTVPE